MPSGNTIQADLDAHRQEDTYPVAFGTCGQQWGLVTGQASATVRWDQSGTVFICAVDAVMTLPAVTAASKGCFFTFVCGALSSGTGLSISPNSADNIYGQGLTAVDDKDLINSGATDRLGDFTTIMSDGTNWLILHLGGTWAKQA